MEHKSEQWHTDIRIGSPFRWRKPRLADVNHSTGDLFHEDVPEEFILDVFAVMAQAQKHTFQVFTKRPERMMQILSSPTIANDVWVRTLQGVGAHDPQWPLPNVRLGTSVEDQVTADKRIPELLKTLAAVRFLSVEPMLGTIDLSQYLFAAGSDGEPAPRNEPPLPCLHWVICGGESGPGARPIHPDWVRSLRDQSQVAGVPFRFEGWGEWVPCDSECGGPDRYSVRRPNYSAEQLAALPEMEKYANGRPYQLVNGPGGAKIMVRVGTKRAGRLLDGRMWDEMPVINTQAVS